MISCAANCGPLSVVIDLTGSPLSRMSLTTGLFSRIEFLHEHKAALWGLRAPSRKANLRGVFHVLMHRRVLHF